MKDFEVNIDTEDEFKTWKGGMCPWPMITQVPCSGNIGKYRLDSS